MKKIICLLVFVSSSAYADTVPHPPASFSASTFVSVSHVCMKISLAYNFATSDLNEGLTPQQALPYIKSLMIRFKSLGQPLGDDTIKLIINDVYFDSHDVFVGTDPSADQTSIYNNCMTDAHPAYERLQ